MGKRKQSAGLLMYRSQPDGLQVYLVHPGGPFFAHRDAGVWSLPKGEVEDGDDLLEVAQREFHEETGQSVSACASSPNFLILGSVVQKNGKTVNAWGFEGDWPSGAKLESNLFRLEWPPHSGQTAEFPEVDRGEFFSVAEAKEKINPAQATFLDRLLAKLADT